MRLKLEIEWAVEDGVHTAKVVAPQALAEKVAEATTTHNAATAVLWLLMAFNRDVVEDWIVTTAIEDSRRQEGLKRLSQLSQEMGLE